MAPSIRLLVRSVTLVSVFDRCFGQLLDILHVDMQRSSIPNLVPIIIYFMANLCMQRIGILYLNFMSHN